MRSRGGFSGRYLAVAFGVLVLLAFAALANVSCQASTSFETYQIPVEEFVDEKGTRVEVVAREALIKLKPGIPRERVTGEIRSAVDLDLVESLGGEFIRIRSRTLNATALVRSEVVRQAASYAGPNHILYGSTVPNDAYFAGQWGLRDPASAQADIRAVEAWDLLGNPDSSSVTVAVLDSGIKANHEDLKDSMWSAPGSFSITVGTRSWSCGRGAHGVNALTGGKCATGPEGSNGHGTKVAGIVGAAGNNQKGVAGVAWKASLMSIVVIDSDNRADEASVAIGIDAAVALSKASFSRGQPLKLQVISLSVQSQSDVPALHDAVDRASAAGILMVVSAGNYLSDNDGPLPTYPASYDAPNIVSVAASAPGGKLSVISNFGFNTVDIAAPGENIYTTERSGSYGLANTGTSMAAPFVSGAAALLFAKCPGSTLASSTVKDLLMQSADKLTPLTMKVASEGRLNLYKALRACGLGAG